MATKLERDFQAKLIKDLRAIFQGALVIKNDPNYTQGIPDLLILYKTKWALLEVKRSATSPVQPNQQWYVDYAGEMSFGAFVYPENRDEVLESLSYFFN